MGQSGHGKSRGLFFSNGKKVINWEHNFLHHRIVSAVQRVEYVTGSVSYTVLRGRWFNNIVLNIHAPNKKKARLQKSTFMKT